MTAPAGTPHCGLGLPHRPRRGSWALR